MGPAGIIWPDVEAYLVGYLSASLAARPESFTDDVAVSSILSSPRPTRAITVRDDGGPHVGDVRGTARIGVNVWAGTNQDVADLTALVVALVAACPDGSPVVRAQVNRGYDVPDGSEQPHRYFTAELVVRGTTL